MIMQHLFLQYSKMYIYGKTGPRPRIRFDLWDKSGMGGPGLRVRDNFVKEYNIIWCSAK